MDARGILSRGRFQESTRGTFEWARMILARGRCNGRLWVAPSGGLHATITPDRLHATITPDRLHATITPDRLHATIEG